MEKINMRKIIMAAVGIAVLASGTAWAQTADRNVRLVLQITVDQLRADLIDRYSAGYGKGGFRRLLDEGVFYVDAHHRHADTKTVVGHATLATGTDPAVHGMVANVWLDRATGKLAYNVEDADYPLLGESGGVDAGTEIDPTQDEIVLDFAKDLITSENIGTDDVTDYLSISFSSTDDVGHFFGASSLESEDNLHRLDRTLADLVGFIDKTVGLDQTLIVLSADHGASEAPGYLNSLGIGGSYFNFDDINKTEGIAALKAEFGVAKELVDQFFQPYLYLNREAIAARGLDFSVVSRRVAEELRELPGIAYAVSSHDLRTGAVAQTPVTEAVLANFNEDRSGDIYVVFEPHWFVADFDGASVTGSHGSPWAYDTHVPVIWMGPGIENGRVARRVETVDVAPTISAYLGVKYPSGSRGMVMTEITD